MIAIVEKYVLLPLNLCKPIILYFTNNKKILIYFVIRNIPSDFRFKFCSPHHLNIRLILRTSTLSLTDANIVESQMNIEVFLISNRIETEKWKNKKKKHTKKTPHKNYHGKCFLWVWILCGSEPIYTRLKMCNSFTVFL